MKYAYEICDSLWIKSGKKIYILKLRCYECFTHAFTAFERVFKEITLVGQTKVITLKTQLHAVNACWKRLSQLNFTITLVIRKNCLAVIFILRFCKLVGIIESSLEAALKSFTPSFNLFSCSHWQKLRNDANLFFKKKSSIAFLQHRKRKFSQTWNIN